MERGLFCETSTGPIHISLDSDLLVDRQVCSKENAALVAHFSLSYICLLGDSPLPAPLNRKPKQIFRRFFNELTSNPIRATIKRYSELFDKIVSSTYLSGSDESITGPFLREMLKTPIFKEYHIWWRTGDPGLLKYILTFLRFGKKLEYVDEDLNEIAFRDWLKVEEKLSDLVLPDLSVLKQVVQEILPPLDEQPPFPHFGPGAVSEDGVRGFIQKACNLMYDPLIDRAFFRSQISKVSGIPTSRLLPIPSRWDHTSDRSTRVSTLRFVPKDVTKSRSICMEPNTLMYFQMVVHDWLRLSMRNGPLRDFIHIEDQSWNQRGAIHGSEYGSVDTIDLSSASDSVSIELVRKIFPRKYLYYLLATRSSQVRCPDGQVRSVKKFAPMGSAVCFPVQCIIFSAVITYCLAQHDLGLLPGEPISKSSVPPGYFRRLLSEKVNKAYRQDTPYQKRYEAFQVYGDDLIVDHRIYDHVTLMLTSLGFSVNAQKSFSGSQALRESCGVYAWNGEDVTPMLYRVKTFGENLSPTALASMIAACNNAGDRGLRTLQRFLIHSCLSIPIHKRRRYDKNPVLFVDDRKAFGIYTKSVRNDHLRKRWNADYQRDEWRSVVVEEKTRSRPHPMQDEAVERYLYLQWQRARIPAVTTLNDSFGAARYRPEETRVGWRWTPSNM